MGKQLQKTRKSTTVRIYEETKGRLQNVVFAKIGKEKRAVTEMDLASAAIDDFCKKEEKKLGI